MWVRLTLWGFCYTHVTVEVVGDEVPLTGTLKQDDEKQAQYLLVRVCLPSCLRPSSPSHGAAQRCLVSRWPFVFPHLAHTWSLAMALPHGRSPSPCCCTSLARVL